jgi:putative ABC transport system ATP-binding protein
MSVAAGAAPVIDATALRKTYTVGGETVHALAGVDVLIRAGEMAAILGASGSGKSTLMHILGCLDKPDAGTYRLDGEDITAIAGDRLAAIRNRRIGFIFQSFHLLPRLDAVDNVALPLRYARRTDARAAAEAALRRVGLGDRMRHRPNQLSGGQRQRVAIARALLRDAPVLLLDEPTSALDAESEHQVQLALAELMKDRTVVVIAHRLATVQHADRIHVIAGKDDPEPGTVLESGTHAELVARGGAYARLAARQRLD